MANVVEGHKLGFQFPGAAETGVFPFVGERGEMYPLVDEKDIAKFVIEAFEKPEVYGGREIEVASEGLSTGDMVEMLRRVSGRDVRGRWVSEEEVEREEGRMKMTLVNQLGFKGMNSLVNWEALKGYGVELGTFKAYLEMKKGELDKTYAKVPKLEEA